MKILKIIVGIFCFAITINTFRNGVPTYENLAHYAEFIPVLILFIIGILLFKSASKPEIKKNVVIISGNNNGYSNIEKIEEKLKILKEAYDDGIINEIEFEEKKDKFSTLKESISSKNETASQYNLKKEKLSNLFKNDIISNEEFNKKIHELQESYKTDQFNLANININSKLYYISQGTEHGPVTIGRLAHLIENNNVSQNCFIRLENESSYNLRANEIIKC